MSNSKQITLILTMFALHSLAFSEQCMSFELSEGSNFRDAAWLTIALTAINAGLHAAITAIGARSGGAESNHDHGE